MIPAARGASTGWGDRAFYNVDMASGKKHGCGVGCLSLITPRVVLVILFLVSDYVSRGIDLFGPDWLWVLLGFLFAPILTLAGAIAGNETAAYSLGWWGILTVGAILDFGLLGSGTWGLRKKRR